MYIFLQLNFGINSAGIIGTFYLLLTLIYGILAFKVPLERRILFGQLAVFMSSLFTFFVKLPAFFVLLLNAIGVIPLLTVICYSIVAISRGQGFPKLMLFYIFFLCGTILLNQGWRLDPIHQFNELLMLSIIIYLCYGDIREIFN